MHMLRPSPSSPSAPERVPLLQLISSLPAHLDKCDEEVGEGDEQEQDVREAKIDGKEVKDVDFHAWRAASDRERDTD